MTETTDHTRPVATPEAEAASSEFVPERPVHRLDVGPVVTLSTLRLLIAILIASAATGGIGWLVTRAFQPAAAHVAWWGAGGVALAFLAGLGVLRPWRGRHLGRWPMAWLAHLGACFVATLVVAGGLLYSASAGEHAAVGLVVAAGHFIVLMAEAVVIGKCLKPYSV